LKRILLRLTLAFSGTALANKQCSPFDKENDGGIPQDNAACCEGAFNDDGCGPCTCENGCKDRKQRNVGDPVDALSGFAWLDDTDVNVVQPWGPPISFVRTYSTAWAQSHGGTDDIGRLGPGWSHNWADHLVLSGPPPASLVILRRGDTSTEEHRFDGTKYAARAPNKRLIWDAATSSYALELSDGGWLVFDVAGKLRTVRAPDGGESQLRYVAEDVTCAASASRPAGALCRVDFLFERSLWFDYDASGRLAQVSWDSAATNAIVKLGFDVAGYLTSFTRADTSVTQLAYAFDHAFPRMPGVTVKLLTLVTDPDGKRASSFRYYQPALSPSRVIEHETPTTLYQFSYGNWAGRPIRTTKIRSSTENISLTWANGRLASVCELDSAGNCDVSKAQETTVPPTGVSDSTCTRESAGNFTRIERDSLGRKLAEYPGLKSCAAPSAAEALIGKKFGYLGSTAKPAFESVPSVDATAPAGFVATTVWDYTQPAGAIDPHCGSAACWTSSAYNAAPLNDRTQREVTWGRTLVDENGSWGTQVQVTTWGCSALGQLTTIDGPRRDVSDLTTRTYYAAGGSPGPASLQQIQRRGRIVFQASDYDLLGNARTTTDENGLTTTKTFDPRGRLRTLLRPGEAAPMTWEYATSGKLSKLVDPGGGTTQNKYDTRGRIQATGRVTRTPTIDWYRQFGYSGTSQLVSTTDYEQGTAVRAANYGYDSQGRQVATQILRTTLAASKAAGVRYAHFDGDGRVDWATDEGWITTFDAAAAKTARNREYVYDSNGRLSEERQRMRGVWVSVAKMTWDTQGQLATYTDSRGVKVRYQHDDFGRLVEIESPDFGLFRYVHDEASNLGLLASYLNRVTEPSGRRCFNDLRADYRVDSSSRLMSEELPGSLRQEFPRALREYVWIEDQPVAVIRSKRAADGTVTFEGITWIHGGHLGEPIAETDEFGHVVRNHGFEPFGARQDLAVGPVPSVLATKNPYTFETLDVSAPGARAMRVHLGELQLGTCDAVQVIDFVTQAVLGEVLPGSAADQWLGPYPTDRVRLQLQSKSCGAGRGFKIIETQAELGAQSVQALTQKTAMPYPAAGERFTFNLTRPTWFRLSNITLGTCDAVEARRVGTGEVLWKAAPKTFLSSMWTAWLTGDIELGIWGVGCNGTEKKNGFGLVQSVSEEPSPPASPLALPGQRITAGGLHENWNRFYDPALGRYLTPDPMMVEELMPQGLETSAPYSYTQNRPVTFKDPKGLITLETESARACGPETISTFFEAYRIAEKMQQDCECNEAYNKGTGRKLKDDLDSTKFDPSVFFSNETSHYHDGSDALFINCGLRNIDPCQMAVSVVHELYHWGRYQTHGASTGEGGAENIDKKCGKLCKKPKGVRINNMGAP